MFKLLVIFLPFINGFTTTTPINVAYQPSKHDLKNHLLTLVQQDDISSAKKDMILDTASRLSYIYPPDIPFAGWSETTHNPLNGTWELLYTTAPDATVTMGKVYQEVNTKKGTFTNIIRFNSEIKKLKEIRVLIEGTPDENADNRINLNFKRFTIFRNSRFGKKVKKLSIPIPSFSFLKTIASTLMINSGTVMNNPYKTVMYVDDDMRIHRSSANKWYIQKRVTDDDDVKRDNEIDH